MGDLIRREELLASQFVHTECYLQANEDRHYDVYKKGWNDALQAAYDNAPAVDAVEVVRCRDCKWWKKWARTCAWYSYSHIMIHADDYCSHGERKTDV